MQSRDFWSIPFVGGPPQASDAPSLLVPVLQRCVGSAVEVPNITEYDQALGEWLSAHGLGGALDSSQQLRAMVALGLLVP